MHRFHFVLLGLLVLQLCQPAHSPAQPTSTATTALVSTEDCENCIDDDADGFTDREDDDCAAPANGGGLGIGDPASAKGLVTCAKAVRKVGTKLTATTLGALQSCLKGVADCVQLKPGEAACRE